jgi:O-antigen/teichoic acid export membrane protein
MSQETNQPADHYFDFVADRKTITKSAVNSVLIRIVVRLKGFITLPILTSLMAPEEMGVFNIITVTAGLITPLFTLNIPDGTLLFFAQEKSLEKIQKLYMTMLNSVGLWSLMLSLLSLGGLLLFWPQELTLAFWVALMLYSEIIYKLSQVLPAIYQKTDIMLKNIFARDMGLAILSILLVWAGLSYKGLVLAGFIGFIISAFFLYRKVFDHISYSFTLATSYIIPFLKISLPLLPVFFFEWIIRSSDSYVLVYFQGEGVVGKYHVVYGLSNIVLIFTYALNIFWFPVSARMWQESREKYRKAFVPVFTGFVTALSLSVLLFELNTRIIMRVLVSRASYREAYTIMGLIAFAFAMQVLITLLTAPLYSNKNPSSILGSYVTGGVLNIILNFLLIPRFSFLGAAVATAISYLIVVLMMGLLNYRIPKFRFLEKRLVYIVPIFLLLWVVIAIVRDHLTVIQVLIGDMVLVFGTAVAVFFIGLKKEEKNYLFDFIKSLKLKDITLSK